jgi:poly(A) polymerase
MLSPNTAHVETAARRLRLANAVRDRLIAAAGGEADLAMDDRTARAQIYRLGRPVFIDRVLRSEAQTGQAGAGSNLIALAEGWAIPRLPIGGRQVAAAGLAAGPLTGRILAAFEDGWIADDFPDHGHAERLRTLVEALPT